MNCTRYNMTTAFAETFIPELNRGAVMWRHRYVVSMNTKLPDQFYYCRRYIVSGSFIYQSHPLKTLRTLTTLDTLKRRTESSPRDRNKIKYVD